MYIYPENLKAQPTLFLWRLKDLIVVGVCLLLSAVAFSQTGFVLPLAATFAYAFLCIRMDDTSIKDFIGYAINFFIRQEQEFKWRVYAKKEV